MGFVRSAVHGCRCLGEVPSIAVSARAPGVFHSMVGRSNTQVLVSAVITDQRGRCSEHEFAFSSVPAPDCWLQRTSAAGHCEFAKLTILASRSTPSLPSDQIMRCDRVFFFWCALMRPRFAPPQVQRAPPRERGATCTPLCQWLWFSFLPSLVCVSCFPRARSAAVARSPFRVPRASQCQLA